MNEDIKQIINDFFAPKKEILKFQDIITLVEEVQHTLKSSKFSKPILLEANEEPTSNTKRFSLPTIKITEAWGSLANNDRTIIEKFTANLGGESTTVEQKLTQIEHILSGQVEIANISDVLTIMMVVEILSSILTEFTESAAGFIFEGFLAGLFGGQSIQITTADEIEGMGSTGKPITDVILAGRHYSLKLLGPDTDVKGSFRNIIEHFKSIERDHIVYLDARRNGSILEFAEFDITLNSFLDVFYTPFKAFAQKNKTVNNVEELKELILTHDTNIINIKTNSKYKNRNNFSPDAILTIPEEILLSIGPFTVFYSEESYSHSVKASQLFGSVWQFNNVQTAIEGGNHDEIIKALEQTNAYKNPGVFKFTPNQVKKISSYRSIGSLDLGEETLKRVWLHYGELLNKTIEPVYFLLNEYTRNVNSYFLEKDNKRKSHGMEAIRNIHDLAKTTTEIVIET